MRVGTGQLKDSLLKLFARTDLALDSHPRGIFRFARLCLQKLQTTEIDGEFSSGAKIKNLFFRCHFAQPRDAMLAVDAGLLKITDEFGKG